MYIYVICPVRNVTEEQTKEIADYVAALEKEGHRVHYPPRDVNQNDETGINIVGAHMAAMRAVNRVDIFWDKTSSGSHFDLGMAMANGKRIKLVKTYQEDNPGKSYVKVMQTIESCDKVLLEVEKSLLGMTKQAMLERSEKQNKTKE